MSDTVLKPLEKRTWCYIHQPDEFEIAPCECGNSKTQWSEFVGHLWCDKCNKDFMPAHNGVFSGPIAVGIANMLGVSFDRINLVTHKVERFNLATGDYSEFEVGQNHRSKDHHG